MKLVITPATGGQPIELDVPGSSQQGVLRLASVLDEVTDQDQLLVVRGGRLYAANLSAVRAGIAAAGDAIILEG